MDYSKLLVIIASVAGGLTVLLLIALYFLGDKIYCAVWDLIERIDTLTEAIEARFPIRPPTPYPPGSAAETDALIDKWKTEQRRG